MAFETMNETHTSVWTNKHSLKAKKLYNPKKLESKENIFLSIKWN